jgi:hypothetical protein
MQKNKTSKFESIKQALSKVNKCIYKETLGFNSISLLEKSAITGRPFDFREPRPKKQKKPEVNPLQVILKSQHKNSEGIQIYQLPKLPFGVHESYNDDSDFFQNHFKTDEVPDEMMKNLEVLSRKFKLNDKRYSSRAKSSYENRRKDSRGLTYQFKMESGFLVCPQEKEILEIYEKDLQIFRRRMKEMKKIDKTREEVNKEKVKKQMQDEMSQRLCPSRENFENSASRFYKSKYSALFSDFDDSTRPVTGFQKRGWDSLL